MISHGAPYHIICTHTCRYACMHECAQAQHWLSLTPRLNIWMSESFSGRRQQQGQSEHLGRLQGGEWVCSSVGRLTHFIISLSHMPQIYCMHEWAMAIVKQAHVRTQHKATDGKIYGQRACFDSASARWQIPTQNIYYICSYVKADIEVLYKYSGETIGSKGWI